MMYRRPSVYVFRSCVLLEWCVIRLGGLTTLRVQDDVILFI